MRVVISGASGSIGTALCEECVKQNIEVMALIQPGSPKRELIPKNPLVNIKELSLEEYATYASHDLKYDVFFHLAWGSTKGDTDRAKVIPHAMNIKYALDAVDLAERLGCKTFVGAGSQAEYGRTSERLTEDTPCFPETAYGIAKLAAGQLTGLACKEKGIKHIWPRILSAYGPNCQPQTIINYTITELLNGRKPSLSKGEQIWDFIYTGDVARALLLLADKGKDGEVYVIGSGEEKPLKEYLLQLRDLVSPGAELGFGEKAYSENTVMHLSCDICKLKRDTGYAPETGFDEGIIETIKWVKSHN